MSEAPPPLVSYSEDSVENVNTWLTEAANGGPPSSKISVARRDQSGEINKTNINRVNMC